MGWLENIADSIYAGFKGQLSTGVLRQVATAQSGGLDDLGDPVTADPEDYPCQGFTDEYSDFFRASAGIPDTDLKVNIFAASLPSGVRPKKDSKVKLVFRGVATWYQVRKVGTDPARALWVCQSFEIPSQP